MRTTAAVAVLATLGLFAACATHVQPGAPRQDRSIISSEQMQSNHFRDVYEAVLTLHANWLHHRGHDSLVAPNQVLVYVDGMKLGGVDALRTIPTSGISYVRHYDGLDASSRWGLNHGAGVIYVSTTQGTRDQ